MKTLPLLASIALATLFSSCSNAIEVPKGTSQGYTSARLIERNPKAEVTDDPVAVAKENRIHKQIQQSSLP